jgi:hypothetical protein
MFILTARHNNKKENKRGDENRFKGSSGKISKNIT